MNDPLKNPGQVPESYQPQKPEMMRALEEAQELMPIVGAPIPFSKEFGIFELPAARVIGFERRFKLHGEGELMAAPLWDEAFASDLWNRVLALPQLIPNSNCGWTCDYDAETDTFSYLASALCPAGTSVPEGCQFRDIPPTCVAGGLWGEDMDKTIKRLKKQGYVTNYKEEGCGWNAELYFGEEQANPPRKPKPNPQGCRWLVPCKPKKAL